MSTSYVLLANLKAGRCSNTSEVSSWRSIEEEISWWLEERERRNFSSKEKSHCDEWDDKFQTFFSIWFCKDSSFVSLMCFFFVISWKLLQERESAITRRFICLFDYMSRDTSSLIICFLNSNSDILLLGSKRDSEDDSDDDRYLFSILSFLLQFIFCALNF